MSIRKPSPLFGCRPPHCRSHRRVSATCRTSAPWHSERVLTDVDAVLFDAGGVLVMPDPEVIGRMLDSLHLDSSARACHRLHFERMHLADELSAEGWSEVDHHLARHVGLDGEHAGRAARLFSSTFGKHRSVAVPEAVRVLGTLHVSGKALGVVSNSDGTLAARLAEDAVCSEDGSCGTPVAFVLDSAVVGFAKPAPGIFGLAVERLERLGVDPRRCLFVGDTLSNDVVPAAHARLIPVHLDPYRLCDLHDHSHITSLPELLTHVDLGGFAATTR